MAQTFDPYGNPYVSAGPQESNFGYTGQSHDENGLLFLRARYYDARQGRFFQMDPSRQERNPYQYSMSNPIMLTDPSGLFSCQFPETHPELCWWYREGNAIAVPLVNEDTGYLLDRVNWYGDRGLVEGRSMEFLTEGERRYRALEVAVQFADDPPGRHYPWGVIALESSGDRTNCNDCISFVSYVLWRAGFRMTGVRFNYPNPPTFSGTGWSASTVMGTDLPGRSPAWRSVVDFANFWTNTQPGEPGPRGYLREIEIPPNTDLASYLILLTELRTLQIGDVILYDYVGANAWDHAAMVVTEGGLRPVVASRGRSWQSAGGGTDDPTDDVFTCTGGTIAPFYSSDPNTGFLQGVTVQRIGAMHIDYSWP